MERANDWMETMKTINLLGKLGLILILGASQLGAQEFGIEKPRDEIEYSPHINKSFPQQVFWADSQKAMCYFAEGPWQIVSYDEIQY